MRSFFFLVRVSVFSGTFVLACNPPPLGLLPCHENNLHDFSALSFYFLFFRRKVIFYFGTSSKHGDVDVRFELAQAGFYNRDSTAADRALQDLQVLQVP